MITPQKISRRTFLRGAGVTLALPMLEAMLPRVARAETSVPRRLICINTTLGLRTENLFPTKPGKDYELTPYLEAVKEYRNDFTVCSGLSHPQVDGGHVAEASYLTAAPHPNTDGFKNTISLDQYAVEKLNPDTRIASLALASSSTRSLSFTRSGVLIPAEDRASRLFKSMFVDGTPAEIKTRVTQLQQGQSIMDTVLEEAKDFQRNLGKADRDKLDEYFTSVREVETRMIKGQDWAKKPKPKVNASVPVDIPNATEMPKRVRLMIDLMQLALQTDSTRIITFALNGMNAVPIIDGVTQDWHNLSHHGQDPAKLAELKIVEIQQMKLFGELLGKLKSTQEQGATLLDRTTIMFGSNLGNASSHDNKNMPIILAGGGFKHGQHLAFDPKKNPPLCNLFVNMLQSIGVEGDKFGSSSGTLPGLEAKV